MAPGSRNIVCDKATLSLEARSLDPKKLLAQVAHMKECLTEAASKHGGEVSIVEELLYEAYSLDTTSSGFALLRNACTILGLPYRERPTLGGSDANVLNAKGIPTIVCTTGYEAPHTTNESIQVDQLPYPDLTGQGAGNQKGTSMKKVTIIGGGAVGAMYGLRLHQLLGKEKRSYSSPTKKRRERYEQEGLFLEWGESRLHLYRI